MGLTPPTKLYLVGDLAYRLMVSHSHSCPPVRCPAAVNPWLILPGLLGLAILAPGIALPIPVAPAVIDMLIALARVNGAWAGLPSEDTSAA